jgi:hypothetical protein
MVHHFIYEIKNWDIHNNKLDKSDPKWTLIIERISNRPGVISCTALPEQSRVSIEAEDTIFRTYSLGIDEQELYIDAKMIPVNRLLREKQNSRKSYVSKIVRKEMTLKSKITMLRETQDCADRNVVFINDTNIREIISICVNSLPMSDNLTKLCSDMKTASKMVHMIGIDIDWTDPTSLPVISTIAEDSLAIEAGLRKGDPIEEINNIPIMKIGNLEELYKIITSAFENGMKPGKYLRKLIFGVRRKCIINGKLESEKRELSLIIKKNNTLYHNLYAYVISQHNFNTRIKCRIAEKLNDDGLVDMFSDYHYRGYDKISDMRELLKDSLRSFDSNIAVEWLWFHFIHYNAQCPIEYICDCGCGMTAAPSHSSEKFKLYMEKHKHDKYYTRFCQSDDFSIDILVLSRFIFNIISENMTTK